MKSSRKAQSILEYTLITALVIAGILIMGPYVIRSINAFFKSASLQVEDALNEEPSQGPAINGNIPGCDCGPYEPTVCGDNSTCEYTQRVWIKDCNPPGCAEYFGIPHEPRCEYDDECCTPPEPTMCGLAAPPDGCPPGVMGTVKYCGENLNPVYGCDPSLPGCTFYCDPKDPNSDWCVPPDGGGPFSEQVDTVYYDRGECPTDPQELRCAAECKDGYTLKNGVCKKEPRCLTIEELILNEIPGWRHGSQSPDVTQPGVIYHPDNTNLYIMNESYHDRQYTNADIYYPNPKGVDPANGPGAYTVTGDGTNEKFGRPDEFRQPPAEGALLVKIFQPDSGDQLSTVKIYNDKGEQVFYFKNKVDHWTEIVFADICCGEGNLIRNPGFEVPLLKLHKGETGKSQKVKKKFQGKWKVEGDNPACKEHGVEIHYNYRGTAQEGNQYLAMNCGATVKSLDDIRSTVPGRGYELSFYYSPQPGTKDNKIGIYWNDTLVKTVNDDGTGNTETVWRRVSVLVKGSDGEDRVSFKDESDGTLENGGYIDNVRLVEDPSSCQN